MNEYKINRNRPKLDKESIEASKDFGSVLKQVKAAPASEIKKSFYKTKWFYSSLVVVLIAASVFISNNFSKQEGSENNMVSEEVVSKDKGSENFQSVASSSEEDMRLSEERKIQLIEKKSDSIKTEITKIQKRLPPKPRLANNKNYRFELDINALEFPELVSYRNIRFEVHPSNKNFTKKVYETEWDNAELKSKVKNDSTYLLVLTKGVEKKEFAVYPVFVREDFKREIEKYNAANKNNLNKISSLKNELETVEKKKE